MDAEAAPVAAPADAAAAAAAGAGEEAAPAPVVRSFTFTPISGNWADEADDDEDEGGREGSRAAVLDQLKEKYQHRCEAPRGTARQRARDE